VVRDPGRESHVAASGARLGHDHGDPLRGENCGQQQPDGASAADEGDVALLRTASYEGVVADGKRFDEGGLIQRDITDRMHPPAVHDDLLAQASAAPGQPDKAHLRAEVVVPGETRCAFVAYEIRFHDHAVTNGEAGDAVTERADGSREFMTHRHWDLFMSEGVRVVGGRDEDRSLEVFVQVCAANATPRDIDRHGTRSQLGLGNIVDADVVAAVETCSFHDVNSLAG